MTRDQIVAQALLWTTVLGVTYWLLAAAVIDALTWAARRDHGKHRHDSHYLSVLDVLDGVHDEREGTWEK